MGYTDIDMLQQLLWRPLSPVSYVVQLFLIGAALAVALRAAPAGMRLAIVVFALSSWFAVLWMLSLQLCGGAAAGVALAFLFGVPASLSGLALITGEPLRVPWVAGAVLIAAHAVHWAVTSSFRVVLCL